jgi:hypothetical protein
LLAAVAVAAHARAAIVGVDIEAGNGSPVYWTSYRLSDVNTVKTNLIAEDGSTTTIGFLLRDVNQEQNQNVPASQVPIHTNPLDLVGADIIYSDNGPNKATWSGLVPNATYNYWIFTSSSLTDTITAVGSTTDTFISPTVNSVSQNINGILGSDTLTFASYARQVKSSASGTIDITIFSINSPTPSGYALELVQAVTVVPEPASIVMFGLGALGLAAAVRSRRKATIAKLRR